MQITDRIQIHDLFFVPLISEEAVQDRVRVLGQALTDQYRDKKPLFISILSGAFVFASDLIRAFDNHCEIGFVKLASYTGTRSSGDVQTVMGLDKDLRGRHLVVVEDIVDTGRTLHFFLDHLRVQGPASISVVTFLRKTRQRVMLAALFSRIFHPYGHAALYPALRPLVRHCISRP